MSMQKAKELLGEQYFLVDTQYGWVGDGGFFMLDVLDGGETVQCVLANMMEGTDEWAADEWRKELDRSLLEKALATWTETPLRKGIVEAMLQKSDLKAYAGPNHEVDAPTYSKGRVCIMGDAAHSMTPWQGFCAELAIEDAMIVETPWAYQNHKPA
ncbi:hypothetical protein BDV96DRAFT_651582 [Lophiotrema nucula]|uniref:FAD-binding domain-containing protein n=1 Tax=Lophiotrema nucula TaxID=690887 RepID=A0A6A5YSY4_9PLEO|nr:hypothetical protein BDV96DRAFT_651582 [Lophiotrema nucula]